MFEKNMRFAYLLDFYGDLLDEKTASCLRAYYDDDLSLSEIGESENISRQGIRHTVKKGEEMLAFYEEKLGLAARYERERETVSILTDAEAMLSALPGSDETRTMIKKALSLLQNKGG